MSKTPETGKLVEAARLRAVESRQPAKSAAAADLSPEWMEEELHSVVVACELSRWMMGDK